MVYIGELCVKLGWKFLAFQAFYEAMEIYCSYKIPLMILEREDAFLGLLEAKTGLIMKSIYIY
jgi:hypothetical protein